MRIVYTNTDSTRLVHIVKARYTFLFTGYSGILPSSFLFFLPPLLSLFRLTHSSNTITLPVSNRNMPSATPTAMNTLMYRSMLEVGLMGGGGVT